MKSGYQTVFRYFTTCYNYTEEEFLAMNIHDLESPGNMPAKKLPQTKTAGFIGRQKHYKKSGELIEVEVYSNPIIINDTAYQSVLVIDISESHSDIIALARIDIQTWASCFYT